MPEEKKNNKMGKAPLQMSSIEFAIALILAIVQSVFSMTWTIKAILLVVLFAIIGDLINRSPWTIRLHWVPKIILFLIFAMIFVGPARDQWILDHPIPVAPKQEQPKAEQQRPQIPIKPVSPDKKEHKEKESPTKPLHPKESQPDVVLKFIYPKSPALKIVNLSDSVARDIKWMVLLWNLDIPDRNDPLPIPVHKFDWIREHSESGPEGLFNSQLISPLLKDGNRLFGSASVDCPTCIRGRTYIVYIVWGEGGWFSEIENEKSGSVLVPKDVSRGGKEAYFNDLEAKIPENKRVPIQY